MKKSRKEREIEQWAALEKMVDERDAIVMEVMQGVFRLPYGQQFTLSDGSVAHLEKLSEPELCPNEHSDYFQRPQFGVDVVIEGGKLDHIEISAFQTGSGMAVGPSNTDRNAIARLLATNERVAEETPEHASKWATSERNRPAGHSGSRPPGTWPERGKQGADRKR